MKQLDNFGPLTGKYSPGPGDQIATLRAKAEQLERDIQTSAANVHTLAVELSKLMGQIEQFKSK